MSDHSPTSSAVAERLSPLRLTNLRIMWSNDPCSGPCMHGPCDAKRSGARFEDWAASVEGSR